MQLYKPPQTSALRANLRENLRANLLAAPTTQRWYITQPIDPESPVTIGSRYTITVVKIPVKGASNLEEQIVSKSLVKLGPQNGARQAV